MSTAALTLRQVRYENKSFWRNPISAFFTFAFPLILLVLFNLLFGNGKTAVLGHTVSTSQFYVPALTAFSVIGASFTNLAMNVTFAREQGVLKRKRGTPLPPAAYLGAKMLHAIVIAFILAILTTGLGRAFYGVQIPTHTVPAFVASLIVGAVSFCALGLAVTAIIPNADAAPAVVNAIILPLLFISDIFVPLNNAPAWLRTVAKIFPIWHFSQAMLRAFSPFVTGGGFSGTDLIVMAVWGLGGLVLATRFFRWEPTR